MAPVRYIHDDPFCAVCNGTHDMSTTSLHKKQTTCRYYQTGSCRRGPNCPFAHVSVPGQAEIPTLPHPAYQTEHMYTYHLGPTPIYPPLDSQAYPIFLWKQYTALSPSFDPRYGFVRQIETLPDYPDDKTDPSSVESSSTVVSMDYQLRTAHDTTWLEGAGSPHGDVGASSSPGYATYGYPVFPAVKVKHGRASSMAPSPSLSLLPRKKPLAYKTKPCKFYAASGKCASGEKCTFIHELESKGHAEISRPKLAPLPDAKLPPKPLDKYDECRARDFYPITWRVIGGGVMMGGRRQICPAFAAGHCKYGDDCKLAHETELETDLGFVELKSEPVGKGDGSPRQPKRSRPKSTKVETHVVPSTTPQPEKTDGRIPEGRKKGHEEAVASARHAPISPVHRRTRSMSMVLTLPPPLEITTQSNYAAEL